MHSVVETRDEMVARVAELQRPGLLAAGANVAAHVAFHEREVARLSQLAELCHKLGDVGRAAAAAKSAAHNARWASEWTEYGDRDKELFGADAWKLALQLDAERIRLEDRAAELASQGLAEEAREIAERAKATKIASVQAAMRSTVERPIVRIGPTYAGGFTTRIRIDRGPLGHVRAAPRLGRGRARRIPPRAARPRRRRSGAVRGARHPGRLASDSEAAPAAAEALPPAVSTSGARTCGDRQTTLRELLAAVVRGRRVRLTVPAGQLSDTDSCVALEVVAHLLGARAALGIAPNTQFPATEQTLQAVAAKIGLNVSIKRCRAMRRALVTAGVIAAAGSYRQNYSRGPAFRGWRVQLFVTGVAGSLNRATERRTTPPGNSSASIGRRRSVKRETPSRWWQHALFGCPTGRPPPGISPGQLKKMRSADERGQR